MKAIELTRGQTTFVDNSDYDELIKYKWHVCGKPGYYYASRQYRDRTIESPSGYGKQILVAMHRVIMEAPKGMHVDHIDGNSLNNQRYNLRVCTSQQNIWNQKWKTTPDKPFKGVSKYNTKKHPGWTASICVNGVVIQLGWFKSAEVAAKTYDKIATIVYGEYARLNFP